MLVEVGGDLVCGPAWLTFTVAGLIVLAVAALAVAVWLYPRKGEEMWED